MASITHFPDKRNDDPRRSLAQYLAWLEALEQDGLELTMWQAAFIASVRRRFDQGWVSLTAQQAECLQWLFTEKTGKEPA